MPHSNLIIIGSGMAGYTLLRELRKLDKDQSITLICADAGDFYSKPMLSNGLAQNKTPDSIITQVAEKMVETQQFELVTHTLVDSIDPTAHKVRAGDREWSYDRLVLATGASPARPPMAGDAADAALVINHVDDYRVFRDSLDGVKKIAIIGPGLIGCEFANDLASQGIETDVIGPDAWPISTLLPEPAGRLLQQNLETHKVRFHLHTTVEALDHAENGYRLTLANGEQVDADLVLSAIGLRPNTDLAATTGLEINRGIVCNRLLQTSDEAIFALGDCAEINGFNLPFIMPIMHGARALAKTLSGTATELSYPAMPVAIKTPACPLVVAPGAGEVVDTDIEQSEEGVKIVYRDAQGNAIGFVLAGSSVSEKQALTREMPKLF